MNGWSSQNSGRTVQPRKAPTGPHFSTVHFVPPGLSKRLGVEQLLDFLARVAQGDRLAAVDLLDFLAGHGVERLDPALVHDRDLADLVVAGPTPIGLTVSAPRAGRPANHHPGQDQPGESFANSSHIQVSGGWLGRD